MRVNAPAEAALAAVREVTAAEMPLVRPFSGLVRRSWLAAARRRAEAAP